jgi:PAS domain S-box-containing protein
LLAQVAAQRAKLRSLIMQTPVPIAVYEGPDARYELVNDAYAALIGGRGDLVGRPLLDVFPTLHEHPSYAAVAETFRTGEPRTLTEVLTPMARDGVVVDRYFTVSHSALRDETGQVSEVAAVGVEVTEQVQARQALERAVRFAEQFVGMLGHDLRNPLNAIEMAASMMKRKLDSNADTTLVERVIRSGRRMSNMVDQLLDLTRARLGGGIAITRKRVMLADVISAIVDELRLVYPDRQIVCEVDAAIGGDWDEERLGQIVSNLVGNALQYGDAAHAVTVTAGTHDDAAWFEVRNYGTPMSPEMLAVLFEPYHGTGVRAAKTRGLGLGLYITQQIVAAHDGRIEVESTAERGTVFKITLPKATSTTVQERSRFVS